MTDDELNQAHAKLTISKQAPAEPEVSDDDIDRLYAENILGASAAPAERPVDAFTQGFGNAATLGYLPQIQAAAEPVIQGVMGLFGDDTDEKLREQGFSIEEAPSSYVDRRDQYIRDYGKLKEENKGAAMAGELSGAVASGIATGGGLSRLLGTGTKALGAGQRFGQAVKTGGAIGVARNPGDVEGEISPLQIKDRLKNAAKDAATGLVIQGGLETIGGLGRTVRDAATSATKFSRRQAVRATGANKAQMEKMIAEGTDQELGKEVLDSNIIQLGSDARKIAQRSTEAVKESGKAIDDIYAVADKRGTFGRTGVRDVAKEYSEEAAERLSGRADADEIAEKINDIVDTIPENATYGELRKWRQSIDDMIDHAKQNKDLSQYQKELKAIRNKVQDKVVERIGKFDKGLSGKLAKENRRFNRLAKTAKFSTKKAAGNESNTNWGLREGGGALAGSFIGGVPGLVIGGITANVARKYGTPFVAMTADRVARALERNSATMGKFAQPLIDAANRSPKEFVATVNAFMKDPEFMEAQGGSGITPYRGPARDR